MLCLLFTACGVLIGCGVPADQPEAQPASDLDVYDGVIEDGIVHDSTAAPAPLWSGAGLETQPRMAALQQRVPSELGYTPGTTPWSSSTLELPEEFGRADSTRFASPEELVGALIPILEARGRLGRDVWERTSRIWHEDGVRDEAIAVVLQWGLKDDAVTGHDFRIQLRNGGKGWHVERIDERSHCSRSVTEDGLCA